MKESVMYQEIKSEGKAEGFAEGIEQGIEQGRQLEAKLLIRQLKRRIGSIPENLSTQVYSLSVEQLENLGEALLDFTSQADLENWLRNISSQ